MNRIDKKQPQTKSPLRLSGTRLGTALAVIVAIAVPLSGPAQAGDGQLRLKTLKQAQQQTSNQFGSAPTRETLLKDPNKPTFKARANLLISPKYPGSGGQPYTGYCDIQSGSSYVAFEVRNGGTAASTPTVVQIIWATNTHSTKTIVALKPGQRQNIRFKMPSTLPSGAITQFTLVPDHVNTVPEINDTKSYTGSCLKF